MPKVEPLDDQAVIARLDKAGMLAVIGQLPVMLQQAEKLAAMVSLPPPAKLAQVVVAGMGGSAIAGDLAAELLIKKAAIPIISHRNYGLPGYAGEGTVVFALSYSGDTEETLSAVKEAERVGAKLVCITSGGRLREIAESKRYPLFLVPGGYQPRAALPYILVALLSGLAKLGLMPSPAEELKEAGGLLAALREEYGAARPARTNPAKQLAKKLAGKVPVIFGSAGTTAAAALRFKTQLNENSKLTAVVSCFPELNHNEIVNLASLKKEAHEFALVLLRDDEDNERIKKRIEITKSLIGRQIGGVSELAPRGRSRLARLLSLIFIGDYVSVYLALLQGIDPTPVEVIARLKKELTR